MKLTTKHFEWRTRDNGDKFICPIDDVPEWLSDLCHAAHGDMLPDDERYKMIYSCVEALENDEPISAIEPPIYTRELLDWLGSRLDRQSYCDEAMSEGFGGGDSIMDIIRAGWCQELCEVGNAIESWLETNSEDCEDE
jgi:hypothetical protein